MNYELIQKLCSGLGGYSLLGILTVVVLTKWVVKRNREEAEDQRKKVRHEDRWLYYWTTGVIAVIAGYVALLSVVGLMEHCLRTFVEGYTPWGR